MMVLTKKEEELIVFIREEMPYGRGILITHNGEPQRVERVRTSRLFRGSEKKLDKTPKGV